MSYENTEMGSITAVQPMGDNGGMFGGTLSSVVVSAGMGALAAVMTGPREKRKKVAIWGAAAGLLLYFGTGVVTGGVGPAAIVQPFTPLVAGWGVSKLEKVGKLPDVGPAS
jgi:hypothetical protein